MSKVIYLDGTERLVFTRHIVDRNYRPDTPLSDWEITLLQVFTHACLHPGQIVWADFGSRQIMYRELERRISQIRQAFNLDRYRSLDFNLSGNAIEIVVRPLYDEPSRIVPEYYKLETLWNSIP